MNGRIVMTENNLIQRLKKQVFDTDQPMKNLLSHVTLINAIIV